MDSSFRSNPQTKTIVSCYSLPLFPRSSPLPRSSSLPLFPRSSPLPLLPRSSSLPSSLSSYSSPIWKYDVFPSFHGPDVCTSVLGDIFDEFRSKGILPFIDNDTESRKSISPELIRAIRESKTALVMLSSNYASSSWCLNVLVEIIKCRTELGQVVVPVFYEVDPIEVRRQMGDFGRVFRKTCQGKTKEDIERWKQAFVIVTAITCYDSRDWDNHDYQETMIENIATHISYKLNNPITSSDFNGLVGMGAHIQPTEPMSNPFSSDEESKMSNPFSSDEESFGDTWMSSYESTLSWDAHIEKMCSWNTYTKKMNSDGETVKEITFDGFRKVNDSTPSSDLHNLGKSKEQDNVDGDSLCDGDSLWPCSFVRRSDCICDFKYVNPTSSLRRKYVKLYIVIAGRRRCDYIPNTAIDECEMEGKANEFSHSQLKKQGKESIITYQDQKIQYKTTLSTSERASKRASNGFLHTVYIYCLDTLQYSFPSHLSTDFRRKGIYAPVNYDGTMDEIEGVSAYVVVFSEKYLSSTSFLDKLVRILQCRRRNSQLVVPVFYGISPSDVELYECKSADRISEWSSVVQEVRKLTGYHYPWEECSESGLVEEIVKAVYGKLFPTEQIGINSRLLEIEKLLCKQSWGIRRIGIWGMPGIGKTTLAKAAFDLMSRGYEASCFIEHFDKAFQEKGRHRLLEEHFRDVLKELPRECSSITRPSLTGSNLNKKRTLVVLDDVHNPLVAESFLGGFHWFGPGSLIIITSRDKQVFRLCQISHVYEVCSLDRNEALQLFFQCVCVKDIRKQKLLKLSREVIDYASGNPLALSYYGKELNGKKLSEMKITFQKLKTRTPYKIYDLFKSSYETLNDTEKNIFLDIACFFNGENVEYVMQLLEGCGFFPHVGINVLVEKCLVTISENIVKMHNIIQDFGRGISSGETVQIERRLWEPRTIRYLLKDYKDRENEDHKGNENIESISLDTSKLPFDVKPTAFEDMLSLRFLKIYSTDRENDFGLHLPNGLNSLPNELRLLHWDDYPLQSLPQDFDPNHLVELNMSLTKLQKLWGGTKNLDKLKTVRLNHSEQLTEIDHLCKAQNIELIELQCCTKLQSFPATDHLQHLRVVDLSGCTEITSFPEVSPNIEELYLVETGIRKLPTSIGNATHLEILDLSDCSSLVELPSSLGNATNLRKLNLSGCSSLVKLPASIGNANNLEILSLYCCSSLVELPYSIGNATNLQYLNLSGCSRLVKLSSSFGSSLNLKELYFVECSNLVELPTDIGNAIKLKVLDLRNCSSLIKLPASIGNATSLKKLYLRGCESLVELPASIGNATNLKILDLTNCSNLVELPSSIGNATSLKILNLENCLKLKELPWCFRNILSVKQFYLAGCSSLVDLPSSISNSTSFMSIDQKEDNSLPLVTFSDNSESRRVEVRRIMKRNIFVLKGERKDEHSVSLNTRMVDWYGGVMDIIYLFYQKDDTASKVSREMVKELRLTDEYTTFIAELIDILLVNMIPNWKTDVAINHLTHCLLNQNKDKTQGQEETAFHDVCKPVSPPRTSDSEEEDEQCVDVIKVDGSSNQELEEATEPVSLEEEERLRQELEEIEAKYEEEMQEIARKREEAIMEAKKKQSLMKKRTT